MNSRERSIGARKASIIGTRTLCGLIRSTTTLFGVVSGHGGVPSGPRAANASTSGALAPGEIFRTRQRLKPDYGLSHVTAPLKPCPPLKMLDRESLALYQGTTLVVPPPRHKALGFSPCRSREQKPPGPKGPPYTVFVSARLKSCPDTNPKRGSLLDYHCSKTEAHFHPSLRPAGPCSTLSKMPESPAIRSLRPPLHPRTNASRGATSASEWSFAPRHSHFHLCGRSSLHNATDTEPAARFPAPVSHIRLNLRPDCESQAIPKGRSCS